MSIVPFAADCLADEGEFCSEPGLQPCLLQSPQELAEIHAPTRK